VNPLSRRQAEALLAPLRGGRALYDELRPAYVSLDPLITLLRRRRFTGVILAAGGPGDGALWLEGGRLSGAWLFSPGAEDAAVPPDPLDVLRILWSDADARVAVHPGAPPAPLDATADATTEQETGHEEVPPPTPAPASPPVSLPRPLPAPPVASRPAPAARPGAPHHQPRVQAAEERAELGDPALAEVPWSRLLPETLARVRRHRGTPLAQRLEETINEALGPAVTLSGRDVRGEIDPRLAAAALRAVADGLGAVAGAAFAERLLWTVGRDFACEDAVKRLLITVRPDGET
jgi:hypothetical protein